MKLIPEMNFIGIIEWLNLQSKKYNITSRKPGFGKAIAQCNKYFYPQTVHLSLLLAHSHHCRWDWTLLPLSVANQGSYTENIAAKNIIINCKCDNYT